MILGSGNISIYPIGYTLGCDSSHVEMPQCLGPDTYGGVIQLMNNISHLNHTLKLSILSALPHSAFSYSIYTLYFALTAYLVISCGVH